MLSTPFPFSFIPPTSLNMEDREDYCDSFFYLEDAIAEYILTTLRKQTSLTPDELELIDISTSLDLEPAGESFLLDITLQLEKYTENSNEILRVMHAPEKLKIQHQTWKKDLNGIAHMIEEFMKQILRAFDSKEKWYSV